MPVLVVGSIAFDTIETPYGKVERALGGSATYFSYAASFFTDVRLVGVVGRDFPSAYRKVFEERRIDTGGFQVVDGRTFNWHGRYEGDMSSARTLEVNLNVFGSFDPVIPQAWRDTPFIFLANGVPALQMKVLDQVNDPVLAVCDTMNFWIENARNDLLTLLGRVDGVVLNDAEARMLTGKSNLVAAGHKILEMGPSFVVIKKGEHGAMAIHREGKVALPARPVEEVKDPTGAGDTFAAGLMGYLAEVGRVDMEHLKRALAYGTVTASFTVEDFGLNRLRQIGREQIDERLGEFARMVSIEI